MATPEQALPGHPQLMSSFFPSPPSIYTLFTQCNLSLAKQLVSHPLFILNPEDWKAQQSSILKESLVDEQEIEKVNQIDLRTLIQPPDIDVIEGDGHWMAFGQVWPASWIRLSP